VALLGAGHGLQTVRTEVRERLTPHAAGWYAGEDPYSSYYGAPLRLGGGARRFDVSPAWFSWASTAPTLELLLEIGIDAIHEHDLRLANRFRAGLLRTSWHVYNTDDVDELLDLLSTARASRAGARAGRPSALS
jgi:selenocysteine lyase/cysteine desulfurase